MNNPPLHLMHNYYRYGEEWPKELIITKTETGYVVTKVKQPITWDDGILLTCILAFFLWFVLKY